MINTLEIGKKYGMTFIEKQSHNVCIDFGKNAVIKEFYELMHELAKSKNIEMIECYKEAAIIELKRNNNKDEITYEMLVAETCVMEIEENDLWDKCLEGIRKVLGNNNYRETKQYYFELYRSSNKRIGL